MPRRFHTPHAYASLATLGSCPPETVATAAGQRGGCPSRPEPSRYGLAFVARKDDARVRDKLRNKRSAAG
jgi:hypothetical protein